MSCTTGSSHTIFLSNDGLVYGLGTNVYGQLGYEGFSASSPRLISVLPKIKMVSCGDSFTVCVDIEGFMWSFGYNSYGQLGTGTKTDFDSPRKIKDIPLVQSISCGREHTLIISYDDNLWSCGSNQYGQLALSNEENQLKPVQTSFSNIMKISAGCFHSLFQNNKGEIYGCGFNRSGQLGNGCNDSTQLIPCLINIPPKIIQFCCGESHSLFLDMDGNVFSTGGNFSGCLGLGHDKSINELAQIPNIPPIKTISAVKSSSYLLDFDGDVWSCGLGIFGKLGHGDSENVYVPTKIKGLQDITQISCGRTSDHFLLAKDYQNTVFVMGNHSSGQIGTSSLFEKISTPKQRGSEYSTVWGDTLDTKNMRTKSARK